MEVAAGIITIIGLIVGWWLQRDTRTVAQKIEDQVVKEKKDRLKLSPNDLSSVDYERRSLLQLLLRYKKYKTPPKR